MTKRILVIDDNEDILELLRIIFQEEGYEVIISNTAEAAEHIHFLDPNLIVLDIRLEGSLKDGAELCLDLKTTYPNDNIPVILVSAEKNIGLIASYCLADAYLSKPFDLSELLYQVKELIT